MWCFNEAVKKRFRLANLSAVYEDVLQCFRRLVRSIDRIRAHDTRNGEGFVKRVALLGTPLTPLAHPQEMNELPVEIIVKDEKCTEEHVEHEASSYAS